MQGIDHLCDMFQLIDAIRQRHNKLNKYLIENKNELALEKLANQIEQIVYKASDNFLKSKGITNRLATSMMLSSVIEKCLRMCEIEKYLHLAADKMKKVDEKLRNFTELGLPEAFDTNEQFIGKNDFKKKMEDARKIELDQFSQNPDVVTYLDSIKPLLTLNAKLTEESKIGSNLNHELLTNLQVKQH